MKKLLLALGVAMLSLTASAENTELWWGYYDGTSARDGLGVEKKATYNQAFFCPGIMEGKKISAIRIYLRSTSVLANLRVWISTSRPASAEKANVLCQSIDLSTLNAGDENESCLGMPNDIVLDSAYTIPSTGLYVGCSYYVNDISSEAGKYPVVIGTNKVAGGLWFKTSQQITTWTDEGEAYGVLAQQVLLSGEFNANCVTPSDFGTVYAGIDTSTDVKLTLQNGGSEGIHSIDYVIGTEGEAGEEQHLELETPFTIYGVSTVVTIPLPADSETGTKAKTITITKVNGVANESTDPVAEGTLTTLQEFFPHRVTVEEFTGTGCGWCPRGLQGMENLRETFGDSFIGIGLHQYNSSDPMYLATSKYASLGFSGAPSCKIERGSETDPYYGSNNDIRVDFQQHLDQIAEAGVEVSGYWTDEDQKYVMANATVKSSTDCSNYDLAFVLVADSVTGTSSSWKQANYYYQYTASSLPADLAKFGSGGELGTSYFSWVFNDVAIASSYVSGANKVDALGTLTAYEPVTREYKLTMPTKTALLNAVKAGHVFVVALVINKTSKKILNAAKYEITEVCGVKAIEQDEVQEHEVARYNLAGQQVNADQKGFSVVKMSDGKAVKMLVK